MNVIDVKGFKQGLAAIMEKFQLNSLNSYDKKEGGKIKRFQDDGIYFLELINISAKGAHPGEYLQDVVKVQLFHSHDLIQDISGLFRYYKISSLTSGDQPFHIYFDDGGKFELDNITIIGEAHHENSIQQRESE